MGKTNCKKLMTVQKHPSVIKKKRITQKKFNRLGTQKKR